MSGVSWQTGYVEYVGAKVLRFENDGVVWYDAREGIALDGWQKELEPYEGWRDGATMEEYQAWLGRVEYSPQINLIEIIYPRPLPTDVLEWIEFCKRSVSEALGIKEPVTCQCSHEWGDHNIAVVQTIPRSGGECLKCTCKRFEPGHPPVTAENS